MMRNMIEENIKSEKENNELDRIVEIKYFPGYVKNKNQWERYKNVNITNETFTMITNGMLKNNKSLFDY